MLDHQEDEYENNNYDEEYLYLGNTAHPVIEYQKSNTLQSSSSRDGLGEDNSNDSNTPFFFLEVTWPRLVQFYYPSSSSCQSYRSKFIQLARKIRHHDTVEAVQFYTINCAVHTGVCEEHQPDYFRTYDRKKTSNENNAKPLVVAFEMGSISSHVLKPIQTNDDEGNGGFDLDTSYVADMLNIDLATTTRSKTSQGSSRLDRIYADATASFFAMMKYNIYPIHSEKRDSKNLASETLDNRKVEVLKDFLDLCHWSLPSTWNIHSAINDLRNEFSTIITEGSRGLRQVIRRHEKNSSYPNRWSSACHTSDGHRTQDINYSPSQCGMWKFLHILSLGIAEQKKKSIMGDTLRVNPSYAAIVIRDFVDEFFSNTNDAIFCDGCRDKIVLSYDTCDDYHQTYYPGKQAQEEEEEVVLSLCSPSFWSVTKENSNAIHAWRHVAIWLWNVHNQMHSESNKYNDAISYRWPPKDDCPSCQNGNDDEALSWNTDSVYDYLRREYLPPSSEVTNYRITVLQEYTRSNVHNRRMGRTGLFSLWFGPVQNKWISFSNIKSLFIFIFFLYFYVIFSDKIFLLRNLCRQFSAQLKQKNRQNQKDQKDVARRRGNRKSTSSTNRRRVHLNDNNRSKRKNSKFDSDDRHFRVTSNPVPPIFLDA